MKSERRHELEQNALADWMTDLIETTKPYANHIMVGVLVLALGLVAYTMWARNATARTTDAWDAMLTSVISGKPSELEMTADGYSGTKVGFLAGTVAGDLRLADGCRLAFESKSQANQELEKAIDDYRAVVDDCRDPDILARAQYGLGRAYEVKGELDKAKEAYEAASKAQPQSVYAKLARDRFDDLQRPDTLAFYKEFKNFKSSETSPVKDEPGTPGERPSFKLEDLPELGRTSAPADSSLYTPKMTIDGKAVAEGATEEGASEEGTAKKEATATEKETTAEPKPDASKPADAKPDAAKPADATPEATKPDAAKPDAAKPDAAKPDAAK